ncbi:hypothetical protein [Brevibacterium sp. CFH 10365]|nr:hypothetical protein [Brevibacterium sp. CFH 10365]
MMIVNLEIEVDGGPHGAMGADMFRAVADLVDEINSKSGMSVANVRTEP